MCLVLLCRHATDVDELHEEVLHTPAFTCAVLVALLNAKLKPPTVSEAWPVKTTLGWT
jgi:hypothetical protein